MFDKVLNKHLEMSQYLEESCQISPLALNSFHQKNSNKVYIRTVHEKL